MLCARNDWDIAWLENDRQTVYDPAEVEMPTENRAKISVGAGTIQLQIERGTEPPVDLFLVQRRNRARWSQSVLNVLKNPPSTDPTVRKGCAKQYDALIANQIDPIPARKLKELSDATKQDGSIGKAIVAWTNEGGGTGGASGTLRHHARKAVFREVESPLTRYRASLNESYFRTAIAQFQIESRYNKVVSADGKTTNSCMQWIMSAVVEEMEVLRKDNPNKSPAQLSELLPRVAQEIGASCGGDRIYELTLFLRRSKR